MVIIKCNCLKEIVSRLVHFWWLLSATWAVTIYYAYTRTWKPFNPILGETYEMANHLGINFISEQASF